MITIHTHPSSSPPSISDLRSNYIHEYSLGVVCGHNGRVYLYTANEEISLEQYDSITGKLLEVYKNKDIVSELVLEELQKRFDVMVKEVE